MKILFFLLSLMALTSCEFATLKYGYYWNPVNVLAKAADAIEAKDVGSFSELLSGKVLCAYGSQEGVSNLRRTLSKVDQSNLQEPVISESRHLDKPQYNGFYTYYQESYVSKVMDAHGRILVKVTLQCDFGSNDFSQKLVRVSPSLYDVRACSIVDIKNFDKQLKVPEVCADL